VRDGVANSTSQLDNDKLIGLINSFSDTSFRNPEYLIVEMLEP
jgi:hypothetical protein